jgi:hypothetical protein
MSDETSTTATNAPNAPVSPAAAPAAPDAGANQAADSAPNPEAAKQAALLDLTALDPDTPVRMKVNGKDVTVRAADAIARLQRGESATQKYQQAAQERERLARERQQLTQSLSDPARFRSELQRLGMNPGELAERIMQMEIDEQTLTPEQRQHRQLQAEIAQMEAWKAQQAAEQQHEQAAQFRAGYEAKFNEIMDSAAVGKSGTIRKAISNEMASFFSAKLANGEQVRASELRQIAADMYAEITGEWRTSLRDEDRRALLRDDDFEWYRQQRANTIPQAVPSAPAQPRQPDGKFAEKPTEGRPRVVSDSDWSTMFRR